MRSLTQGSVLVAAGWILVFCWQLLLPSRCFVRGDEPAAERSKEGRSGGGTFTRDGGSCWITDPNFPWESHNPGAEEQQRLRVEWGTVREGTRRDEVIIVKGKLFLVSKDGKSKKPVDWVQGVGVVLAKTTKDRPDWSKGHSRENAGWGTCEIGQDASFEASITLHSIRRVVGKTADHQVGLSLASKSGQTITWRTSDPVLPQTISTLKIPGPRPLSHTLQLINAVPSVMGGRNANPVALIRVVNHLHAFGKDKALAALREFLEIAGTDKFGDRDPVNIDTSDYQCVFLIVRLLFEPAKANERVPHMYIGAMIPSPAEQDEELWPLFPVALRDDIPFLWPVGIFLAGTPEPPQRHVDWAEKHGKLRMKPLRPPDNPLAAVDALIALPHSARLLRRDAESDATRRQAWRMIAPLAGAWPEDQHFPRQKKVDLKGEWEAQKKAAAKLKIRWDENKQEYVAGK